MHNNMRRGAGSGAGVGADGVEGGGDGKVEQPDGVGGGDDGEVDQPDGVGGGGDDEVEQPDGSAATATRQSSGRRAEKKGMDFGETAKCCLYSKAFSPGSWHKPGLMPPFSPGWCHQPGPKAAGGTNRD